MFCSKICPCLTELNSLSSPFSYLQRKMDPPGRKAMFFEDSPVCCPRASNQRGS